VRLLVSGEGGQLYSGDLFGKVVWQGAFREAELTYQKRRTGCTRFGTSTPRCCWQWVCPSSSWRSTRGTPTLGSLFGPTRDLVPFNHERAQVAIDGVFGRPEATGGLVLKSMPSMIAQAAANPAIKSDVDHDGRVRSAGHLSSAEVFPSSRRAMINCWICWVPSKMSIIFASRDHFSSSSFSV
jgi:hypothetical protein